MAKVRQLQDQPITTGFVVKKKWKIEKPDPKNDTKKLLVPHIKTVSPAYLSREAANIFRDLAVKDGIQNPVAGQLDVEFFIAENLGQDGLPKGF